MWIISRISTSATVEIINVRPELTEEQLREITVSNYGANPDNFDYYLVPNATYIDRINNGDEYDKVWSATEVIDLDFSIEDSKYWLKIYTTGDKTEILGDNVDSTTINIEVWKADKSSILTGFNSTRTLSIEMPLYGTVDKQLTFVNGVATITDFTTKLYGEWKFPADIIRYDNLRVWEYVILNVVLP